MPVSPDFTSIYTQNFEIGFQHCYSNGFLKHTEICNLFQIVAGIHADLGGISYLDMQQHHQAWVLSRMRIEITKLPKWKDVITIKTWIKTLENSRSVRCLEMYLNDEKIVGCETFWAVFNTQSRRPESLALEHDHFQKFPTKATENDFKKIDIALPNSVVGNKKIVLSDIDIVNHANSVKYMEWCLDTLQPELLLKQNILEMEVNYLKEVAYNETVTIKEHKELNASIFTVSVEEKVCFAMEIKW